MRIRDLFGEQVGVGKWSEAVIGAMKAQDVGAVSTLVVCHANN